MGSATEKSGPPASPLAGLSAGYASRSSRATTLDAPKAPHHSQLALKEVLRFYMLDRWFLLWLLLFTALYYWWTGDWRALCIGPASTLVGYMAVGLLWSGVENMQVVNTSKQFQNDIEPDKR